MRDIDASALASALVAVGFVLGLLLGGERPPHCPTEDSCAVDYRDGSWVVTPTVP